MWKVISFIEKLIIKIDFTKKSLWQNWQRSMSAVEVVVVAQSPEFQFSQSSSAIAAGSWYFVFVFVTSSFRFGKSCFMFNVIVWNECVHLPALWTVHLISVWIDSIQFLQLGEHAVRAGNCVCSFRRGNTWWCSVCSVCVFSMLIFFSICSEVQFSQSSSAIAAGSWYFVFVFVTLLFVFGK